ncbi:MAG TPA: cytochrome C [Planctomycetota bacterium]|jgi:mono/diheme cytochrome c family protein|nr:cytochrome C [Planctomycetota bacterium]
MRKWIVIIVVILFVLILLPVGALSFVALTKPNVGPAPTLTVSATPELVERGRYLFNHAAACVACHTPWDTTKYSFPPISGKDGSGGTMFAAESGVPGKIYAANVTPAALKDWSDGEIFRAIASGVNKRGEALFPLMPYGHYAKLSTPDLHALIAYLRTLPAIESTVPARELSFPMNIIVRLIPVAAEPLAATPKVDSPDYPEYAINAAACLHCHSPSTHGKIAPGAEFSGGVTFPLPDGGVVRSANLTSDDETGLGKWTKEAFITRFRAGVEMAKQVVKPGELNSPMPWSSYGGMTDADLGAIYDHLHKLSAVKNAVVKFTPGTAK